MAHVFGKGLRAGTMATTVTMMRIARITFRPSFATGTYLSHIVRMAVDR